MRLIVTHEQPDFDALASLALAKLLYPGAVATVQGALSPQIDTFIKLYRDVLDLKDDGAIDRAAVRELIVVDTADATRIRPFDELIGKVPITVYDHHPEPREPIPAGRGLTERVGATATLLTRELAATKTEIPQPLASLALLGIHEDTGNLSFDLTTADDYRACAYLLDAGASLMLVRRFAHDELSAEQAEFRQRLLVEAQEAAIAGRSAVLAAFTYDTYVPGVSGLVSDLIEMHRADAAVVAVRMDARTLVFARSSERFDSGAALSEALGGAGHSGAAYARTELGPQEALATVVEALERHAAPMITARDLMSAPVRTVRVIGTVADAQEAMLRFGHNGLPVLNAAGDLVGVVSRRDVDRAARHGLLDKSVASVMRRQVVTATPATGLAELEELVLNNNVGRIPVLDEGNLVGIVTRADLIGARHRDRRPQDPAAVVLGRLPARAAEVVRQAAIAADGATLYLVGGTVRDLLLGTGIKDLDVMVEGESAARVGTSLQQRLGGALSFHADFGTCTLTLPNGLVVDIATAREELYPRPGALPEVEPSDLRRDLGRRDFTINAIATRVSPAPATLVDPYAGSDDLNRRQLRILHPLSFIEDPTRILRGARLAGRLGFEFEPLTEVAAREALAGDAVHSVSHARMRAELELTLSEPRVAPAVKQLADLGALSAIFGLQVDAPATPAGGEGGGRPGALALVTGLDALRRELEVPDAAYLLALLVETGTGALQAHFERFNWPRRLLLSLERVRPLLGAPADRETEAAVEGLDLAERSVVMASSGELAALARQLSEQPPRQRLRGRDVVALGLPPGPSVGRVLAEVAQARTSQQVTTFDEELELARRLVARETRPPTGLE